MTVFRAYSIRQYLINDRRTITLEQQEQRMFNYCVWVMIIIEGLKREGQQRRRGRRLFEETPSELLKCCIKHIN